MSGIINKVKEVLHKDHNSSSTTHSTTGHSTTGHSTNAGPHSTNTANAADPRVDSDNSRHAGATTGGYTGAGTGIHGTSGSTNAGPHDSNLANKADPRVDSDRDGRSTTHGTSGLTGTTHNTHGTSGLTGNHSTNAGPHDSNMANKADPRVDSDRDGRAGHSTTHGTSGLTGTTGHSTTGHSTTHNTHNTGSSTMHGSTGQSAHATSHGLSNDLTGSNTYSGTSGSTNHGPHDSNMANKLDPRVDSDRDGSRNAGAASGSTTNAGYSGTHAGNTTSSHTGTHGGISHSTNAGPHDSNVANKADPRVDSDLDGKGNRHGANTGGVFGASGSHATAGSGTAQNTAGPHNSDMLNKIDPRVDSDRDGSKTYGGNATHQ